MNRSTCLTLRHLPVLVLVVLAACGGGNDSLGNGVPAGTVPTATLTAPEDRSPGLFGMVAVTATASDDVAVTGVEFLIHSLRKKLGATTIKNVRGVGWMVARRS